MAIIPIEDLPDDEQESSIIPLDKLPNDAQEPEKNKSILGDAPMSERLLSASIGGVAPAVGGAKEAEASLPMIGQILGGSFGGYAGSIAGTGVGSALEQMVKNVRGQGFDITKVGTDTASTALVDGVLRGAGKLLFRKEIAGELIQSLGRRIGEGKELLRELGDKFPKTLGVEKKPIIDFIETRLGQTFDKSGQAGLTLKRWSKILTDYPSDKVPPRMLIELEDKLGSTAKYVDSPFTPKVPNKQLDSGVKELRKFVSNEVDNLSKKAAPMGADDTQEALLRNFKKNSKDISRIKKQFPDKDLKAESVIPGETKRAVSVMGGAAVGSAMRSTPAAVVAGITIEALQNSAARRALYNSIVKTGVSDVFRIGASEAGRQVADSVA
jgi:hypothetical protein